MMITNAERLQRAAQAELDDIRQRGRTGGDREDKATWRADPPGWLLLKQEKDIQMAKRKTYTLTVRVSVPESFPRGQVAREVRTLINQQCNYSAEHDDVRTRFCRVVSSVKR